MAPTFLLMAIKATLMLGAKGKVINGSVEVAKSGRGQYAYGYMKYTETAGNKPIVAFDCTNRNDDDLLQLQKVPSVVTCIARRSVCMQV